MHTRHCRLSHHTRAYACTQTSVCPAWPPALRQTSNPAPSLTSLRAKSEHLSPTLRPGSLTSRGPHFRQHLQVPTHTRGSRLQTSTQAVPSAFLPNFPPQTPSQLLSIPEDSCPFSSGPLLQEVSVGDPGSFATGAHHDPNVSITALSTTLGNYWTGCRHAHQPLNSGSWPLPGPTPGTGHSLV